MDKSPDAPWSLPATADKAPGADLRLVLGALGSPARPNRLERAIHRID